METKKAHEASTLSATVNWIRFIYSLGGDSGFDSRAYDLSEHHQNTAHLYRRRDYKSWNSWKNLQSRMTELFVSTL